MRFEKFVQTGQIDEDRQHKTIQRYEGEQGEPERELDEKEHHNCYWYHHRKECLEFRQNEYVESQQPLGELLHLEPFSFEGYLDEALIPARALLDELADGIRRLFARDELIFIDDADACMGETETNAKVGIFGQAVFIPATQLLHQFAPHEDGVAAKRGHTYTRKEMHRRFEPEEIFEHVQETEPLRIVVHQLHAALYGIHIFIKHGGIDNVEDICMRLILGVGDGYDMSTRSLQAQVQAIRLIDRRVIENE